LRKIAKRVGKRYSRLRLPFGPMPGDAVGPLLPLLGPNPHPHPQPLHSLIVSFARFVLTTSGGML